MKRGFLVISLLLILLFLISSCQMFSPECTGNDECTDSQMCSEGSCVEAVCDECEYIYDHACTPEACCSDADCDDGDTATEDSCMLSPKICINEPVEVCKDNDGFCPVMCTKSDDADCDDDYYRYTNLAYRMEIRYPSDWIKTENVFFRTVTFYPENSTASFTVSVYNLEEGDTLFLLSQLTQEGLYNAFNSVEPRNTTNTIVNGKQSIEKYYRVPFPFENIIVRDINLISDENKGYLLRSIGFAGDYNVHRSAFEKMMDSFNIIELEKEKVADPFLWKAEINESTFYLFGTMHVADKRVLDVPSCVIDAINDSDSFYTEIPESQSGVDAMLDASIIPGRDRLYDIISEDLYNRTDDVLVSLGSSILLFDKAMPWIVAITIPQLSAVDEDYESLVLDSHLRDIAAGMNKEIGGLETIDEHVNVFSQLTFDEQEEMLLETVESYERYLPFFNLGDGLVEAYLSGHEELIVMNGFNNVENRTPLSEKLQKIVLIDRNEKMVERILDKTSNSPERKYFFAVGVSHLVGNESVIDILEKTADAKINKIVMCNLVNGEDGEDEWEILEITGGYIGTADKNLEFCYSSDEGLFESNDRVCIQPWASNFTLGGDGYHQFEMDLKVTDSKGIVVDHVKNIWEEDGTTFLFDNRLETDFVITYPKDYGSGEYTFEVTVYDLVGKKKGILTKTFTVI